MTSIQEPNFGHHRQSNSFNTLNMSDFRVELAWVMFEGSLLLYEDFDVFDARYIPHHACYSAQS